MSEVSYSTTDKCSFINEKNPNYSFNFITHFLCLGKIKEDLNEKTYIPCSWIGRLNIIKYQLSPKVLYRLNIFSTTIVAGLFVVIDKQILKFLWIWKDQVWPSLFWKKNRSGRLTLPDFKGDHKATAIKTRYPPKDKNTSLWNKITRNTGWLIFDGDANLLGEKTVFSRNASGTELWWKINIPHYLTL